MRSGVPWYYVCFLKVGEGPEPSEPEAYNGQGNIEDHEDREAALVDENALIQEMCRSLGMPHATKVGVGECIDWFTKSQ